MAEGKMEGTLSFLLRGKKNPLVNQPNTNRLRREPKPGNTHRMRHSYRSPITGRFIARRSTGSDLVDAHNRETRRRRLWDLVDAIGTAILFGGVGFMTVWTLAIVWGACK